jgi:soluble lytic murein transglycosylase-like protein
MSTDQQLTIKDYFDRVFTGEQSVRKICYRSRQKVISSGTGIFQRMLASLQMQGVRDSNFRPTGLTIVDYLAKPLSVKGRAQCSPELSSSDEKGDRSHSQPIQAATAAVSPEKDTPPTLLVGKLASSVRRSEIIPSQKKLNPRERYEIEKGIQEAACKYDLSPALIRGIIKAESNFQVDAVSRAGAQGLMQLMPATAKALGVTKPLDIHQNIDGGCRYLRKMLDSFGGDVKLALAAYNAGPGTVRKYAGKVPYQETIQYVDRVLRFSNQTV